MPAPSLLFASSFLYSRSGTLNLNGRVKDCSSKLPRSRSISTDVSATINIHLLHLHCYGIHPGDWIIHQFIEVVDGNLQELRRFRFGDCTLGQRAITETLEAA